MRLCKSNKNCPLYKGDHIPFLHSIVGGGSILTPFYSIASTSHHTERIETKRQGMVETLLWSTIALMPMRIRIRIRLSNSMPILPQVYTCWKIIFFYCFYSHHCKFTQIYIFLVSVIGVIIFSILERVLEKVKLIRLYLYIWLFTDTNPDPKKWCLSNRIRIHKTSENHCRCVLADR